MPASSDLDKSFDDDWLRSIVEKNKDKNFVKRIISPNDVSSLDNKDGTFSTHSMAYAGIDNGRYIVYPEVIEKNGKLIRLSGKDAVDYAFKNKEAIVFESEKDAEFFSKNYKRLWDNGKK